jgi:predicted nucleic acid-binding protein
LTVYLLDTNVVSELRRPRPHGAVVAWLRAVPDAALYVSAVTIGEIQAGIEITRERAPAKASEIESWLEQVALSYNILAMDASAFRIWARFMHRQPDHHIEDAMIAATAVAHGLTVATRNIRDFKRFSVKTFDPFSTPGAG